jgi:RHS repeat-associated protein
MPVNRPSLHTVAQLNFRYDYSGVLVYYGSTGISRSFVYDDEDERVAVIDSRAGDGTRERWSLRGLDHKVLRDFERYNGVWSWKKDYLYRDGTAAGSIGAVTTGEEVHQLHVDHLGTVRIVTTSGGALYGGTAGAYPQKYWPFGDPLIAGTLADRLVFTGHERDDDGTLDTQADLDYMHARYYAPVAGRFLTMDPDDTENVLNPQSWNRYTYVLDNPVNANDPDGKVINLVAAAGGAVIGGATGAVGSILVQAYRNHSFKNLNTRDIWAAAAGGAVSGGLAGLTLGASLIVEGGAGAVIAVNAGANIAGGAVTRAVDSDPQSAAFDVKEIVIDGVVGVAGGIVGSRVGARNARIATQAERQAAASARGARAGNFSAAASLRGNAAKAVRNRTTSQILETVAGAKTTNVLAPATREYVEEKIKKHQ